MIAHMKRMLLLTAVNVLLSTHALAAESIQDDKPVLYTAFSRTAESIIGDIRLSSKTIYIRHKRYPLTFVKTLDLDELDSLQPIVPYFKRPNGTLYKVLVPASTKLVNGNTICSETSDAKWIIVSTETGDGMFKELSDMTLIVFQGENQPVLEKEALYHSHDLCGTYGYHKALR